MQTASGHINYKPAPLLFLLSQPDGSFPLFPISGSCEREFVLFCESAYLASKLAFLSLLPNTIIILKHHRKRLILPDLDSHQPALSKDCHVIAKLDFLLLE